MEFARKQLEKYGWTDGKGLGKHENGISEALKPKLKRSVTGVGHDAAAEFTEHWWTKLYNSAASNVEVKEENGKTKKIKTKDDEFEITNNSWSYKKKNKNKSKEEYSNFFVKTSILTSGGVQTEDLEKEGGEEKIVDEVKLTDEQLFAACGGRTAHKGARHGLKALGKLARIEMQEQALLQQSKYNGYSQAKSKDNTGKSKKEKKKNKIADEENCTTDNLNYTADSNGASDNCSKKKKKSKQDEYTTDSIINESCINSGKEIDDTNCENNETTDVSKAKKKKQKKRKKSIQDVEIENNEVELEGPKKKNKKKNIVKIHYEL